MTKYKSLNDLVRRIDEFIRTYYLSQIIKGTIYSAALLVAFFLIVNILEYFSYFGTTTRALLFFGYLAFAMIILAYFVVYPVLKLFKIGSIINHEQAARIISSHFPEIGDRLINSLQLGSLMDAENESFEFLEAAIEQKTAKIKSIPFKKAVDKKENVRRIPYALLPVAVTIILLFAAPTLIKEPSQRITNYRIEFERPMPFAFSVTNETLSTLKGEDFDLQIKVTGAELPSEVFIDYDKKIIKSTRISNNEFSYRFRNLQNGVNFRLSAGGFFSEQYTIEVIPKPIIIDYTVNLEFPAYIRRANESIDNTGDFNIPIGTVINWNFNTESSDSVILTVSSQSIPDITKVSPDSFKARIRALESFDYVIIPMNERTRSKDSLLHQVIVIPDLYPEILVETFIDSADMSMVYFTGQIKDDYGFNRLEFHFQRRNLSNPEDIINKSVLPISIDRNLNSQSFLYNFDFSRENIQPGDRIEYWFEVWDNDGVNGSKSTRSGLGLIEIPRLQEMERQAAEKQDRVAQEMNSLQRSLFELSREIDQLQKSILQKESISWEDSYKLQEMLERQMNLQKQADRLKEDNTTLNRMQEQINPLNEELLRKQQELQKLFDELMTDEMRKLFEELQKMLDEMDRGKMQEMLNRMQLSNEELMKNLDRNLELFKQLEMEKMITETVSKLKQLAEEQNKLAEETADKSSSSQDLDEKQQQIEEEFNRLKEELDRIAEKNEELEWKYDMIDSQDAEKGIEEDIEKSRENLQKDNKPGAVPHQKDAGKKMDKLADDLMEMMTSMQNEQLGEDIQMVRKLLEDLIDISFDQEGLIEQTLKTNRIDPRYNDLLSEQKRLINNLKMVEDSLNSIAKRQLAVQQFILREIAQINVNVEDALSSLEDRNISTATSRQQFVMTSVNNLALMLSEALDQMNQQMMSSSDDGTCPSSGMGQGKGKPKMGNMKDLQQQLNQKLEQMRQSMQQQGEGQQQPGGQSMSEQFARMAAEQEALRRQMQQYLDELRNETGRGDGNLMKAIEEMEQTERDLVHKRINNETLLRQEQILTRLLESEKAELEREKEERRESREALNYPRGNPDSIQEFFQRKLTEREMLRTVPPQLNSFYRRKVNDYFIQVQ